MPFNVPQASTASFSMGGGKLVQNITINHEANSFTTVELSVVCLGRKMLKAFTDFGLKEISEAELFLQIALAAEGSLED